MPPFEITSESIRLLAEIERSLGRYEGLHRPPPAPQLRKSLRVRSVQSSVAIEGNTLNEEQITALLDGRRVVGPPREILEAQNALATERVQQAVAKLDGAEVLWIPSLNVGVGYNSHAGRLQATDGSIVDVNRESFFAGGGPALNGAPLTGASGGPAWLFVDISPADIYFATDSQPAPLELISEDTALDDLVTQAVSSRPELMRETARVEEAQQRVRQEEWRPWLPNIHVGLSSGVFGGGPDSSFGSFSDWTDFDALAVWQLKNFGLGNQSLQDERDSLSARRTSPGNRHTIASWPK